MAPALSSILGLPWPLSTDRERRLFAATQDVSGAITQSGHAPPRWTQRLPEPHSSVLLLSKERRKERFEFRHSAERFPRSMVVPLR